MTLLVSLLQLSGLLGFTWWLLGRYREPHVSPPVLAAVFLSWTLGFLGLLLLPVDLALNGFPALADVAAVASAAEAMAHVVAADTSAAPSAVARNITADIAAVATVATAGGSAGAPVAAAGGVDAAVTAVAAAMATASDDRARLLWAWQALYWLTFVLSWVALPFLAEFRQNGEFLLDKRVVSSLKRLVLHWSILAAAASAVIVYLVFVGHLSLFGLVGLAMASSNTYGLLWLVALLGYGLVDVPRHFWALRFPAARLQALHFRAVQVHDERMEAIFELEDVSGAVHDCYERMLHAEGVAIILTSDMQFVKTCLSQVKDLVDSDAPVRPQSHARSTASSSSNNNTSAVPWKQYARDQRATGRRTMTVTGSPFTSSMRAPTMAEVVELHRRVLLAKAERRRSEQAWVALCIQAESLQDRIAQRELQPASLYPATSMLNDVRNAILAVHHELRHLALEPIAVSCACLAGVASLCILWSELTMGLSSTSLSLFRAFARAWGPSALELLAFAALLYMVVCAYSSLFKLRTWGKFALQAHASSTEQCLLQTSIHQCRLQFALGYNFLLLLNDRALTDRTAFAALFENMQIVHVFGRGFSVYAPLVLVLLVAFTLSNGYARVMKHVGIEQYEQVLLDSPAHDAQIAKGAVLVEQGLERYRAVARRRKVGASTLRSYGFATTSAGAQALLDGDMSDDFDDIERHTV